MRVSFVISKRYFIEFMRVGALLHDGVCVYFRLKKSITITKLNQSLVCLYHDSNRIRCTIARKDSNAQS